jgi:O-antigen/teichoic acid export membrane protein
VTGVIGDVQPSGYRAKYVNHNTPTRVKAGQDVVVTLTIENSGSNTWFYNSHHTFRLGFQWYDAGGQIVPLPADADQWTKLPQDVVPGEQVTVQAQLRTPDSPGTYQLCWDMLHDKNTPFTTHGVAGLLIGPITVDQTSMEQRADQNSAASPKDNAISVKPPKKKPTFERNMLATARGGGILAAGQLFTFGGRFIIAFLLARLLGAEEYGLYSLALGAATVVTSISGFGLDSAMIRYVAIQSKKQDDAGLWGTVQIGIMGVLGSSILLAVGLYFLAEPIAQNVFSEPQLTRLLQLLSFIVPFLAMSDLLVGIAHGFRRMEYTAFVQNSVQLLVRIFLIIVFALLGLNAFLTVLAFGISDVAASFVLIYFLNRDLSWKRPINSARRDTREILNYSLPFWLSGMLTKFRKNIQILLLGSFSTVSNVGIFSLASKINLVSHVTYSSIVASVKPVIAEVHTLENRVELGRLYQTTTRWTFMFNLPMFLVTVLFPEAILSIFGQSFVNGSTALILLALGELINSGTGICGSIIDMTGYTKTKLVNSVVWVALTLTSNFLLIPQWGLLGAAASVFISVGSINLLRVAEVWFIFRILPYNRTFLKPITAGLVSFLAAYLTSQWLPAEASLFFVIIDGSVVFASYAAVLLLLGLAPEDRTVVVRMYQRIRGYVPLGAKGTV